MKTLLLLLGALAYAQASDLNITNSQDALSYVLNLKCIRKCPSWPCSVSCLATLISLARTALLVYSSLAGPHGHLSE